jgi:hypothetical protein
MKPIKGNIRDIIYKSRNKGFTENRYFEDIVYVNVQWPIRLVISTIRDCIGENIYYAITDKQNLGS